MEIIREPVSKIPTTPPTARVIADRLTLAKRRWRASASDGQEFGFDLVAPFTHGTVFITSDGYHYLVEQQLEPVLEITLIPRLAPVARLAWAIGNLHFPIEITDELIRVPDDPALRQLFAREKIPFKTVNCIFQPFANSHGHAG